MTALHLPEPCFLVKYLMNVMSVLHYVFGMVPFNGNKLVA